MYIEPWKYENVDEAGNLPGGGRVCFKQLHIDPTGQIFISTPRTDEGVVQGVTLRFECVLDLLKFLNDVEFETKKVKVKIDERFKDRT